MIPNLPYLFIFILADRTSFLYQNSPGKVPGDKLLYLCTHSDRIPGIVPSIQVKDLLIGLIVAVIAKLLMWEKQQNSKKFRKGVEYGSARWGDKDEIKPYMSENPWLNIPLTATESITMESRPKNPKYARNKNILVIGGSGSGKTRFFVKPSLMQLNCSYVITDPKGTLIGETGKLLKRGAPKRDKTGKPIRGKDGKIIYQPYVIKVLNTINFSKSLHYNPFAYIKSEKDILKLVTVIMANTKGDGEKENQDFWYKAERLLYTALIAYIWYEGDEDEKNFSTLLDLLNESDDHFLNLRGSLVDLGDLGIPHHALYGVVPGIAIASEELYRPPGHLTGSLGGEQLGHGRLGGIGLPGVLDGGRPVDQHPGSVHPGLHLCQHKLSVLELGDGSAELAPILDVLHRLVDGTLGDAQCLSGDADAPTVQGHHGNLEALVELAQQVLLGHFHVLEHQLAGGGGADAHFLLVTAEAEALHALLQEEGGDALVARGLVGHGEHHVYVGHLAIGDEDLGAVEQPVIPFVLRGSTLHGGVGAGAGFEQTPS